MDRADAAGLKIARTLYDFVNAEAIPGTGVEPGGILVRLRRAAARPCPPLRRAVGQTRRNCRPRSTRGTWRCAANRSTSASIWLSCATLATWSTSPPDFAVATANVDPEIAVIAGPQLVVPVTNARYALNAANARWGSLYDALYGTDALPEDDGATRGGGFNPVRAARVVAKARAILDDAVPLAGGSHADATGYACVGRCTGGHAERRHVHRPGRPLRVRWLSGRAGRSVAVLLRHHHLHIELSIDRSRRIGKDDPAGINDVFVEAAITTIQDCEDFDRRRRRRRQGARLPQLAGPDERRPEGYVREGRPGA